MGRTKMKAFVVSALLGLAAALPAPDVSHHATISHGGAVVSTGHFAPHVGPAVAVAHNAPVVHAAHAVHAAPVVAHAVHAPVAHAVHAAPVVATMPQSLPMPSMLPQLLLMPPQLSRLLLQLTMPQLQLTRLRLMLMRSLHTPSPMLLLMTTQRPTSTLRSSPMVPPMLPDLTPLLFPMDVSNMSNTLPMVMMDMSPMLHTR